MTVTLLGESGGDGLELRLIEDGRAVFIDHRKGREHAIAFDPGPWRFALTPNGPAGPFDKRRRECAKAARRLGVDSLRDVTDLAEALRRLPPRLRGRVRHVVTENHRVQAAVGLLRAGEIGQLGSLISASHMSLRDHYEVSTAELDAAFEAAGRSGAVGARLTTSPPGHLLTLTRHPPSPP